MSLKHSITLDEVYKWLVYRNYFRVVDNYIFMLTPSYGFALINLADMTALPFAGHGGICNKYTTFVTPPEDIQIANVYDNNTGVLLSSHDISNIQYWTPSFDGAYLLNNTTVYLANSTERKVIYNACQERCTALATNGRALVLTDYNHDTYATVFLNNETVVNCNVDARDAYIDVLDENTLLISNLGHHQLLTIKTGELVDMYFAQPPTEATLTARGIIYRTSSGIFLGNKQLLSKYDYTHWKLFVSLCKHGFEDLELLASLTARQLLSFYKDQLY